jgi:mannose-6-phosphate isomerase-like protein (cupin superfamily)
VAGANAIAPVERKAKDLLAATRSRSSTRSIGGRLQAPRPAACSAWWRCRHPKGPAPPPHIHEREDEAFYVLEGSYEVTVGNDRFDAREGFFIFAPRRVPHGYVVRAAPARHLRFVFPSGWETFFHDVVRTMGGAAPAPAVVAELAKERGVTLLGPPPAP